MEPWWQGVVEDFSDLPSVSEAIRLAVRLILAALLGGVLGYERERSGKAAGLRTHMLVALGSALFVVIPQQAAMSAADLSRVIQGIVSGVGFLGAGAILKQAAEQDVKGLTTAAGLWLTAAVGIAAGLGRESSAVLGTILAFFVLAALQRVTRSLRENSQEGRSCAGNMEVKPAQTSQTDSTRGDP
ncbi:MAG: MgtC/SapB family protein [Bryobacteraceae bacterium]